MTHRKIHWKPLILWLLGVQVAGMLGGMLAGMENMRARLAEWVLPAFMPSSWVFGVVWPVLYVLMAISAYLVWEKTAKGEKARTFLFFWIQMALNLSWPTVFFRLERLYLAAIIILLMIVSTTLCMLRFSRVDSKAALLLLPYLVWILFALALNISIAMLNA